MNIASHTAQLKHKNMTRSSIIWILSYPSWDVVVLNNDILCCVSLQAHCNWV